MAVPWPAAEAGVRRQMVTPWYTINFTQDPKRAWKPQDALFVDDSVRHVESAAESCEVIRVQGNGLSMLELDAIEAQTFGFEISLILFDIIIYSTSWYLVDPCHFEWKLVFSSRLNLLITAGFCTLSRDFNQNGWFGYETPWGASTGLGTQCLIRASYFNSSWPSSQKLMPSQLLRQKICGRLAAPSRRGREEPPGIFDWKTNVFVRRKIWHNDI